MIKPSNQVPADEMAKVLVQMKARLQDGLRNQNRNATKRLSKTLEADVTGPMFKPDGIIKGNSYWKFIDEGRGPGGGFTPIKKAILEWMEAKGIRPRDPNMPINSLASAITWKIIKKGYKGDEVFTKVIDSIKADTNLFIPLSEAVAVNLLNIPDKL